VYVVFKDRLVATALGIAVYRSFSWRERENNRDTERTIENHLRERERERERDII
jgi:hypothetical protein